MGPGTNDDLDFIVKDVKRFAADGGWRFLKYDAASGGYAPADRTHKPPQGNDASCGTACHTIAKAKDYVSPSGFFPEGDERLRRLWPIRP